MNCYLTHWTWSSALHTVWPAASDWPLLSQNGYGSIYTYIWKREIYIYQYILIYVYVCIYQRPQTTTNWGIDRPDNWSIDLIAESTRLLNYCRHRIGLTTKQLIRASDRPDISNEFRHWIEHWLHRFKHWLGWFAVITPNEDLCFTRCPLFVCKGDHF